MSFLVTCPECHQDMSLPAHAVGLQVLCPGCQRLLSVSEAECDDAQAADWYVGVGDNAHGPIDKATLLQMIAAGQVDATTLVWHKNMPDWAPAGDVPGVAPLLVPAPSAVQPVAEPTVSPTPEPTPVSQPAPTQHGPTRGEGWYWVDARGNTQGPCDVQDVCAHFASRHLGPDSLVWRPGWDAWKPLAHTALADAVTDADEADDRSANARRPAAGPDRRPDHQPARHGIGFWKRARRADVVVLGGAVAMILCGPLPWIRLTGQTVSGFDTSGIWLFLFGIAQAILIVGAVRERAIPGWNVVTTRVLGSLGVLTAGLPLMRIALRASDTISIRAVEVVVTNLTPGVGMFVGLLGAGAVLVGSLAPMLARTQNWARPLLEPAVRQSAQSLLTDPR